jgi:NADPH:quinone reductase-like Zn-dependent oxidoreductase
MMHASHKRGADDLMKSIVLNRFGDVSALEVGRLPTPPVPPRHVRVRVAFATVNPVDLLFRAGAHTHLLEAEQPPWIPGMEFAGFVDNLGQSHRPDLAPGDPVIGLVSPRRKAGGAQAQYVAVPADLVVAAPDSLGLAEACTLPMNGVTALLAIDALGLGPGAAILVTGAAGAVGGYAVQLARSFGLNIVAHGRPGDEELLRELGAQPIVTEVDSVSEAVRQALPGGVDGVIDAALLAEAVEPALRDGGVFVQLRQPYLPESPRVRMVAVSVTAQIDETGSLLERVAQYAADGVLRPRVARVLPLDEIQVAHELVAAGGLRGRVVLDLRDVG